MSAATAPKADNSNSDAIIRAQSACRRAEHRTGTGVEESTSVWKDHEPIIVKFAAGMELLLHSSVFSLRNRV
jgi:hypothetical protein